MQQLGTRACSPAAETRKLCLCHLVGVLMCKPVTLVVSYLPAGLVGCSVDPRINYDARKLARTPQIKKKKKRYATTGQEKERDARICVCMMKSKAHHPSFLHLTALPFLSFS